MKIHLLQPLILFLTFLAVNASATTHYVDLNCTNPVSPYTDWSAATTNIQDAIDASTNGDLVLVSNGVYATGGRTMNGDALSNRVVIDKSVTVQSVNGPTATVIQGYQMPGMTNGDNAVRCVYMTNGASLIGFTITNGATLALENGTPDGVGGGIWCESPDAFVTNCLIFNNMAAYAGGGVYQGSLIACIISNNVAPTGRGFGGGAYQSTLINSLLVENYGFAVGGASDCKLFNCLLYSNIAGVYAAGAFNSDLVNCTIVNNAGRGVSQSYLTNCIDYYNSVNSYGTYAFCCVSALSSAGIGNFTNPPIFINSAIGDFHLQSNSPCINSGNNTYVTVTNDLDGNPRIVGGTVDIGAYEFQSPSSVLSYAWAQQYGLPTDGTADYADSDGDGMNNWQEWRAGTNPTNSSSLLQMLSPTPTNNSSGVTVTWQSVTNVTYYLQRSDDLSAQPAFSIIQSNIVGQTGTTSYTDTTATNSGPFFYRVGVQ